MSIPNYLLGKHLTAVSITPASSVATNGTITWGTAVNFVTTIDNISVNADSQKAMIKPSNSTRRHNVVINDGFSVTLSALRLNNATSSNPGLDLIKASDYFRVLFTQGTAAGSINAYELHCSRTALSFGQDGEGEQMLSLSLDNVDTGSDNFLKVTTT